MSAERLRGIVPALLTPFTPGGNAVALDLIPPHLRYLEKHGADGVLTLGTNGEFPSLTMDEKRAVCDHVLAHKGTLYVIVGVNFTALPDTVEFARHAERSGADALLVLPPFYFPQPTLEGLLAFYRPVLDAVACPVLLYNFPAYSQVEITDALLEALADYPHLAGVKDTSMQAERTARYVRTFPHLRIFGGNDPDLGANLAGGAVGAISASANVVPDWMQAVATAVANGEDWQAAQQRVNAFWECSQTFPPRAALKYLLKLRGGPHSDVRPPLISLSGADEAALRDRAAALGLLG